MLHVEDDVFDHELVMDRISLEFDLEHMERVQDGPGLETALASGDWDVILSDHTLPDLSGIEALKLCHAMRPEIPFVFLSGTIGEERAVHAIKRGAYDYVLKDNLRRLGSVIARALEDSRIRSVSRFLNDRLDTRLRLQELLASSLEVVFWLGSPGNGDVIWVSSNIGDVLEIPPDRTAELWSSWRDRLHPEDVLHYDSLVSAWRGGGTMELEYRIRTSEGIRWIRDRRHTLLAGTEVLGDDGAPPSDPGREHTCGYARDITEEKERAEALLHSRKIQALGQLAGGVAHDFNNILTVITGAAELMGEDDDRSEDDQDSIGLIREATERGRGLTQQLLSYSRRQNQSTRSVDLAELVGNLADMLSRLLPGSVRLELDLPAESLIVRGDHGRLEQIVVNLVTNARDAVEGEGRIGLELRRVEDTAGQPMVQLVVTDDGCGMTPEVRARVCDPYFTTKEVDEGTGLGMANVQSLLELVGGSIEVDSTPGEGSRFTVHIPAMDPSPRVTLP